MNKTRQLIAVIVGHVDHGKSSLLDNIRGTSIVASEAGNITQAIGASIIPLKTIKKCCGQLLESLKMDLTIPGLLFIDTPGHAAFSSMRKRGGNIADIAVVIIDINEGFKPQTIEVLEILRHYKTPFVIAANKIDLISGWQKKDDMVLKNLLMQAPQVVQDFEKKMYEIVGQLYEKQNLEAERFDRVSDYTKQIAIVPISAKTGEGISELLMVMTGMAQKYLEKCLECNVDGAAKGTILEVKEEKGLGKTIDVILYDGTLKVNDTIVCGGVDGAIVAKVRGLFEPTPLKEMRDKRTKFNSVKKVTAATGVKIASPDFDSIVAGMPIQSCSPKDLAAVKEAIQQEVEEAIIETEKVGLIMKADNLGSLEALSKLFKEKDIPIKHATIGNISKKDLAEAEALLEKNPEFGVIIGFNVEPDKEVATSKHNVTILTDQVIYKLIEGYEKFLKELKAKQQEDALGGLTPPCKVQLMQNYVFRQSGPAVVGTEVILGKLKAGIQMMKRDGHPITTVKSLQHEKKSLTEAGRGMQVAGAYERVTVGRQVNEGDFLYSVITENEFRKYKESKTALSWDEKDALKEIAEIMRKENPMWGL